MLTKQQWNAMPYAARMEVSWRIATYRRHDLEVLSCHDLLKLGLWNTTQCCSSCHVEDEEYGCQLCELRLPDRRIVLCCCACKHALYFLTSAPPPASPPLKFFCACGHPLYLEKVLQNGIVENAYYDAAQESGCGAPITECPHCRQIVAVLYKAADLTRPVSEWCETWKHQHWWDKTQITPHMYLERLLYALSQGHHQPPETDTYLEQGHTLLNQLDENTQKLWKLLPKLVAEMEAPFE